MSSFFEPPSPIGVLDFGKAMCYVELQFFNSKEATTGIVGVVWAPDLFCISKPRLNTANFEGALQLIMTTVALHRHARCFAEEDLKPIQAIESLREHLVGLILLMDKRSDSFTDQNAWCVCRDRPFSFLKFVATLVSAGIAASGCVKNSSTETKMSNVECHMLHRRCKMLGR